jgi:LDH2 family malate/lactate/ureidoglycolate dehydrogenase
MNSDQRLIPFQELFEIGVKALERVDVSTEHAKTTVEVLLRADLRGVETHGISRLLMYVPRLLKGLINPRPRIVVESATQTMRIVHGDNGLGPVVAARGMQEAIDGAKHLGLSFVGCRESNHFGAAAPYVLMACEDKMVGITGTNAAPTMAPWGGLEKILGNNPLAIGVPCDGDDPFVLDMAMSFSSRARIRHIAEKKGTIPEGWALDSEGKPTTDPVEALKGFVLPIGTYKGFGLTVAIDILSGVLTGAGFGTGVKTHVQQWKEPQHLGHFFIVIDPVRIIPWEVFSDRMRSMFRMLREVPRVDPNTPILIPGEIEALLEKERRFKGIPLDARTLDILKGLTQGNYDYELPNN